MSLPLGQTDSAPPALHFQALSGRAFSPAASESKSAKQSNSLFNKRNRTGNYNKHDNIVKVKLKQNVEDIAQAGQPVLQFVVSAGPSSSGVFF